MADADEGTTAEGLDEATTDKPEASTSAPTEAMSKLELSDAPLSTGDVDRLLRQALLQAIAKIQPGSLPLPASSLYSAHVLPNRPATAASGVEIKKSSYKNLSKWMKALAKEGLLTGKEVKGEWMVMTVAKNHAESVQSHCYRLNKTQLTCVSSRVQGLHSFKTVAQAQSAAQAAATESATENGSSNAAGLVVQELFKPSSTVRELLSESGLPA